jgi:hypothetical protein
LGRKKNGMGIGKGSLAKWKTKKSPTSFLRREYIGKEEKKTFKKKTFGWNLFHPEHNN